MRSLANTPTIATVTISFLLILTGPVPAQHEHVSRQITIGLTDEIESKILGEKRQLLVSTPKGYDSRDRKFATLYVLDGRYHFHHIVGLVDYMVTRDLMPPTIVVAIISTDRDRDFTPPLESPAPGSNYGGADNFVAFFRDELIPHIEENFSVSSHRTLFGHSFGGLFAIHTLVHYPKTFDGYIASSPSLRWDKQKLVEQAEQFFENTPSLEKSLYMTIANEGDFEGEYLGVVLKFAGVLAEHKPAKFGWKYRIMRDETHRTVSHRAVRQGLEFVFRDWAMKDPMPLYNVGGVEAIESFYERSIQKYRVPRAHFSQGVLPNAIWVYQDILEIHPHDQKAAEALKRWREAEPELPEVATEKDNAEK